MPIIVAIPPIVAEKAMLNTRALSKLLFLGLILFSFSTVIIDNAIGNIMIAVALLLIHIDKNAVPNIKPNIIDFGPFLNLDII